MAIPSGVIIAWPTTAASIPAGWTRNAALDSRFVKQIATGTTAPGTTGGAGNHAHPFGQHSGHTIATHTHAGSWGTSTQAGGGGLTRASGGATLPVEHTHASSGGASGTVTVANNSAGNTDTTVLDPLHVTVIFIESNGSPTGIPVNGLIWYNGAAPAGFSVYANLANRLMKGAAAGTDGGTQAGTDPTAHTHTSPTHTHPLNAHTHVAQLDAPESMTLGINAPQFSADTLNHGHTLGTSTGGSGPANTDATTETSGAGDATAPWQKLRAVQKITSTGIVGGMIVMWLGSLASIPAGWSLCDGNNGTPNLSQGRFVRGAATDGEVGNTGGAATHTHAAGTAHSHTTTGTHTHTFTGASGADPGNSSAATGSYHNVSQGHSHGSTTYTSPATALGTTSTQSAPQAANSSNDPTFTGVAYIQLTNNPPNTPSAINAPTNGQVFDASLTLSATATDPDGNNWHSMWEYSTDGTTWFTVPGSGGSAVSGAASTLLWDTSALAGGTTYRVRAWALDEPGGLNSATLTMTGTFTLDHNHAPNAPALTAPASGATIDLGAMPTFSWTFSDPDGGDTQSAYALKARRVSDSLTRWWNGATWGTSEVFVTTGTQSATPTNTIFAKGETWAWSVATKDQGGPSGVKTGPYSAERNLLASTKVNPTISSPTAGAPANIPTSYFLMVWAVAEQTKYRARLLLGPGFTTVIQDTGIVTDSVLRQMSLGPMANGASVRFEITTWNNEGLQSNVVTIDKNVVYTVGATPVVVITARN